MTVAQTKAANPSPREAGLNYEAIVHGILATIGSLRGEVGGRSQRAEKMRQRGTRLPILLPWGERYLENRFQFVHVDDVARLIAHILHLPDAGDELTILNVGGRGEPVTLERAAQFADQKIVQLPKPLVRLVLRAMWKLGISDFPPEAFPYLAGEFCMDLGRLRAFLGSDYERVIQFTVEDALRDSFAQPKDVTLAAAQPAGS